MTSKRVEEIRERLAKSIAEHAHQHWLERTVSGTCTKCGNTKTAMVTGWFAAEINKRETDTATLLAELDAAMKVVEQARALFGSDDSCSVAFSIAASQLHEALREFDARNESYRLKIVCDGPASRETLEKAENALARGRAAGIEDKKRGIRKPPSYVPEGEIYQHAWWRGYGAAFLDFGGE